MRNPESQIWNILTKIPTKQEIWSRKQVKEYELKDIK